MTLLATASSGPRTLLGSVSRTMGLAGRRPWLPAGETLRGRLFTPGLDPALGIPLLDEPGATDARVRLGYAPGLTGTGVRVTTMAVRLDVDGRPADLLLTAPPAGRPVPRLRRARRDDDCVLLVSPTSYDAAGRPFVLAARSCGSETFELLCLAGDRDGDLSGGDWRSVADLRVCPQPLDEPPLLADPARHPLPGLALTHAGEGRAG